MTSVTRGGGGPSDQDFEMWHFVTKMGGGGSKIPPEKIFTKKPRNLIKNSRKKT